MLKWLLAALLILNVGVALWIYSYGDRSAVPAPEPRVPVRADSMKLASEAGVALKARPRPPEPKPLLPTEPTPPLAACYRAGPFSELEQVLAAARQLEERGVPSMRREETRPTVTGYRVYLPPFPTRQAAEAKRKELTRLGIRDHALIQEDGRYAVALGFYSVQANASKQQRRLEAKGVRAKLEPVQLSRTAYGLELTGSNLFDSLKDFSWGASGVSLSEYNCPVPAADLPPPGANPAPPEGVTQEDSGA
jgi:hypothetical protein